MNREEYAKKVIDQLFMVNMFLQKVGNRKLSDFGLNQPQFTVLGEIAKNKDMIQSDILGTFLLEKSNLSKIVKKLSLMGLITITTSPVDKRKTILNATEEGLHVWTECMRTLDEMKEAFTAPLTESELEALYSSVHTLTDLVIKHSHILTITEEK